MQISDADRMQLLPSGQTQLSICLLIPFSLPHLPRAPDIWALLPGGPPSVESRRYLGVLGTQALSTPHTVETSRIFLGSLNTKP